MDVWTHGHEALAEVSQGCLRVLRGERRPDGLAGDRRGFSAQLERFVNLERQCRSTTHNVDPLGMGSTFMKL